MNPNKKPRQQQAAKHKRAKALLEAAISATGKQTESDLAHKELIEALVGEEAMKGTVSLTIKT